MRPDCRRYQNRLDRFGLRQVRETVPKSIYLGRNRVKHRQSLDRGSFPRPSGDLNQRSLPRPSPADHVNDTVRRLIREDRLDDMETLMRTGTDGMQTFDAALATLVREELISMETGFNYADDQAAFKRLSLGTTAGADKAGLIGAF